MAWGGYAGRGARPRLGGENMRACRPPPCAKTRLPVAV